MATKSQVFVLVGPLNFMVLPRYWVQNMRESHGDGDQACGTTAVMGLGLRELMHELGTVHLQVSVD